MPSRTCESIEAREIFALFEAGGSDYVAFWKVFIDDSADQKKEEFVVAGIFIGKLPAWQTFQRAWNKTCRQTPRIRYFHGKELSKLDGEFRQFRDKSVWPERTGSVAANAKKEALQAVIKAAPIVGFGMGLYVPEYEKIIATHANAKTYLGKDAFEYVLQVAMYRAAREIRQFDAKAKIAFVSDCSNKSPRYTKVYNAWSKANPNTARHLMGIAHLNDEHWPGLQAADMAAKVVKKVFENNRNSNSTLPVLPYDPDLPLIDRFFRIDNITEEFNREMLSHQSDIKRTIDV